MALGERGQVTFERRFPESLRQRLAGLKQIEYLFQRFVVESVPWDFSLQAAEIAFETPREDDLLHNRLRYARRPARY